MSPLNGAQGSVLAAQLGGRKFSANNAEEIETAKVIRALNAPWAALHFTCYTTGAGKTLSLVDNDTQFIISRLRTLCEDRDPDFMTTELVDALMRLYEVHEEEFEHYTRRWDPKDEKSWILKLSCGHEGSSAQAHIEGENPRPADTQTPFSVDSEREAAILAEDPKDSSPLLDIHIHAPSERDHRAEEPGEPESLINPCPTSSSSN
ncbi:hypothetical protein C8Q74DRAFT_1374458 [Fomes fomentarius]|nr:hypothetical protein C8Q74DRAFT_1374458 [Fomes fomentarius]